MNSFSLYPVLLLSVMYEKGKWWEKRKTSEYQRGNTTWFRVSERQHDVVPPQTCLVRQATSTLSSNNSSFTTGNDNSIEINFIEGRVKFYRGLVFSLFLSVVPTNAVKKIMCTRSRRAVDRMPTLRKVTSGLFCE